MHLPPSRDCAFRDPGSERLNVAPNRVWDRSQSRRDDGPVLGRLGGHQVEDRADVLGRRGDDVQVTQVPPGVVEFEIEFQLTREVSLGDAIDVVDRLGAAERG